MGADIVRKMCIRTCRKRKSIEKSPLSSKSPFHHAILLRSFTLTNFSLVKRHIYIYYQRMLFLQLIINKIGPVLSNFTSHKPSCIAQNLHFEQFHCPRDFSHTLTRQIARAPGIFFRYRLPCILVSFEWLGN
jgi:hypothetical protein